MTAIMCTNIRTLLRSMAVALVRQSVRVILLAGMITAFGPQVAQAGPPFLTDDPEPTEAGHWEVYAPFVEGDGQGKVFQGSTGVELNYGAARDVQVTVGLPVDFDNSSGWRAGVGDVALSVKYRFYHDEKTGLQIAAFPGLTLPTGTNGMGADTVTALLPVWIQQDFGPWSIFGGGGYAINPGDGNRDFWTGGLAVTRKFGDRLVLGAEVQRQGSDTDDSATVMAARKAQRLGLVNSRFKDQSGKEEDRGSANPAYPFSRKVFRPTYPV